MTRLTSNSAGINGIGSIGPAQFFSEYGDLSFLFDILLGRENSGNVAKKSFDN